MCDTSLQQDRSYFEVTVLTPGPILVGIAQAGFDLAGQLTAEGEQGWGYETKTLTGDDVLG